MTEKIKKVKKKLRSPSAFSVLFIIIAMVAALTWVIPSGEYNTTGEGDEAVRVPGTFQEIDKVKTDKEEDGKETTTDVRQGAWDVMMAPISGMKEKLDVITFVLILGGFLGVTMKTGALDASLGALLRKMRGREKWLIPILMILLALGGTTYGMQEETVAFYALIIPMMIAAGYNAMTAVMVIVLGAGTGVLASTVNPFSTGIAARSADVSLGDILGIQSVILVLGLIAAIAFTMRYAAKVKAGKYKEDVKYSSKANLNKLDLDNVPKFTPARKAVMAVFALTFVIMIISLVPWGDFEITIFADAHNWLAELPVVGAIFGAAHTIPWGEWYFNETSVLFFVSALVIATIYYRQFKREETFVVDTFLKGVVDIAPVGLIIAVAAGVSVIMQNGNIQDTIIHWGEEGLRNVPSQIIGALAFIFYIPMSFLIPSSSGLAAATMPILAPIADIVGVSKTIIVSAFATSSGVINMCAPTIASLMAGLSIAGVSYRRWLKRSWPFMLIISIISIAVITIFTAVA